LKHSSLLYPLFSKRCPVWTNVIGSSSHGTTAKLCLISFEIEVGRMWEKSTILEPKKFQIWTKTQKRRWVIWSDHNLSRPVAKFLVVCGQLMNEQDTDSYELFGILSELRKS
jgi:hypothetical protein